MWTIYPISIPFGMPCFCATRHIFECVYEFVVLAEPRWWEFSREGFVTELLSANVKPIWIWWNPDKGGNILPPFETASAYRCWVPRRGSEIRWPIYKYVNILKITSEIYALLHVDLWTFWCKEEFSLLEVVFVAVAISMHILIKPTETKYRGYISFNTPYELFLLRKWEQTGPDGVWGGHPDLSCKRFVYDRPLLMQISSLSL